MGLQGSVARLIYRYLASGGGEQQAIFEDANHKTPVQKADMKTHLEDNDNKMLVEEATRKANEVDQATLLEDADQKTQLLLSLIQEIHTCVHIMQHRTRRPHLGSCLLTSTAVSRT